MVSYRLLWSGSQQVLAMAVVYLLHCIFVQASDCSRPEAAALVYLENQRRFKVRFSPDLPVAFTA